MTNRILRALVYGDVNLNLIDGSAVWLTSMAECLARSGVEVTVLLKSRIETGRLLLPLHELANVHIVEPVRAKMSAAQAANASRPKSAKMAWAERSGSALAAAAAVHGLRSRP